VSAHERRRPLTGDPDLDLGLRVAQEQDDRVDGDLGAFRRASIVNPRIGHHAFEPRAVLGAVKTQATLCLLRLHLRKSRNSERAIVMLSFYPSALAQPPERLAELRRVEGSRIDPPHTAGDGLRARDDATLE
jgi:hypothetical protein